MVLENFLICSFPIQCNSSLDAITELLAGIIGKSSAWVLDIDLDFYSTGNPYRSLFTNVKLQLSYYYPLIIRVVKLQDEYSLLTKVYRLEDQTCSKVQMYVMQ